MYTRKLSSVSWENKNIGSKAANLGELTRTGVPVPPGFVITSDGFDKFLKVNKLDGKIRDILTKMKENEQDVYNYAVRIENMITEAPIPDFLQSEIKEQYEELSLGQNAKEIGRIALDIIKAGREHEPVAVRPSPLVNDLSASSYAGQLSYSLNVAGLERVCRAIKKTWASLFSPRVMFYRKARNIEGILLMGVIVQKMVNPEKSGVMFTADPVTNDSNKIIIDSSWGLPDSVIYGYVSPDNYVIDKSSESVLSKTIGNKSVMRVRDPVSGGTKSERVLSDKMNIEVLETHEIAKLVELAKKIERNYNGQPQNIEWCSERGRFFIVESKPVKSTDVTFQESNTTLPSVLQGTPVSHGLVEGKVRIVLNTPEINKVVQGDLIVTKTITPDMMPIMDKVSGIITDEDSYTGYTSVISREFGIPCVIKTENATAVLKDEQEIVLDAFKGYIYSNKEEVTDSEEFTEETELQ
ncbi:MAG: hypothetical protein KKC05_01610, partial [Nanoarchaeota archaeon]|nr:hypothetical protein [Nanoarchaeota archaeon]